MDIDEVHYLSFRIRDLDWEKFKWPFDFETFSKTFLFQFILQHEFERKQVPEFRSTKSQFIL